MPLLASHAGTHSGFYHCSRILHLSALLYHNMTFLATQQLCPPSDNSMAGALAGEPSAKGRRGFQIALWPARQVPVIGQAGWLEYVLCLLQSPLNG